MSRSLRSFVSLILVLCCLASGYLFYKLNPHDPIIAGVFAFGLTGIVLSFLRQTKREDQNEVQNEENKSG
ncbi:MAG: hypothetical protein GW917_00515 [Bdellovibrionales bacterium]|nr:hypothetical protein [Bdellovibrionales bacterium]